MPGNALMCYTSPMPDDSPHPRQERQGDGAHQLDSAYRQNRPTNIDGRQNHI